MLSSSGNVTDAARRSCISRREWYKVRKEDPYFAADWDEAVEEYTDHLEAEADRRAVEGVTRQIYFDNKGEVIGETRNYSDTLMIFRLKGLRPEMYKERSANELSGPGGGPLVVANLTDEELDARILELSEKLNEFRNQPGEAE